jgi:6-phosphogluconolactonase/glucosamine-6-phosphate isomerase/deaminase
MQTVQCNNIQEAKKRVSETLRDLLLQYAEQSILLLVSGGSMLDALDADQLPNENQNLTFAVLDERSSDDPMINNFAQLIATPFAQKLLKTGAESIDTRVQPKEILARLAERFESALKDWKAQHPQGIIIALQGIGADGHTSGVLPFPEDAESFEQQFVDTSHWVTSYDATGKNPHPLRATTTLSFLRNEVDHSIVYAVGESKREALEKLLSDTGTLPETPARILLEMKQVTLITDIALS